MDQQSSEAEPYYNRQEVQEGEENKVDHLKGKFETGEKETLIVKRKVAKGKDQRKADCSSKTPTDTQAKETEARKAVVASVQGKVVQGIAKQGVFGALKRANTVRK